RQASDSASCLPPGWERDLREGSRTLISVGRRFRLNRPWPTARWVSRGVNAAANRIRFGFSGRWCRKTGPGCWLALSKPGPARTKDQGLVGDLRARLKNPDGGGSGGNITSLSGQIKRLHV